jgi:WD repeat-containing protein 23
MNYLNDEQEYDDEEEHDSNVGGGADSEEEEEAGAAEGEEDEGMDEHGDNSDDEDLYEGGEEELEPGLFQINGTNIAISIPGPVVPPQILDLLRSKIIRILYPLPGGPILITSGPSAALLDPENMDSADSAEASNIMSYLGLPNRREPKDPDRFPKVPSLEGRRLMDSGVFGTVDDSPWAKKDPIRRIIDRELIGDLSARIRNHRLITQSLLPSSEADTIIHYNDSVYGGQFSDDGSFYYSFTQDFMVRIYDTRNPWRWRHYKTIYCPGGRWTLTDAALSPDNKWIALTSLTSHVRLAPTSMFDTGEPYDLDLGDPMYQGRCGLFSIRFSGDGRELVAGTNANSIVVYDIESRKSLHHIRGHADDVNAVCFADKASPHIIYSGSDDCVVKVWDRRSMGDKREAGVFVGHIEGVTYVDSKGDGRYVLSNGKDQSMKLWDLRKAMSTKRYHTEAKRKRSTFIQYDYRTGEYDDYNWDPHPHDNSVVTFRGHKVLRTLIRCHFSPPGSTDSRYVYSGSQDGKVYIWNIDATLAAVIDVEAATKNQRPVEPTGQPHWSWMESSVRWSTLVRDASWHPTVPMMVASAWNGPGYVSGTASIHTFPQGKEDDDDDDEEESRSGISGMGKNVTEKLLPFTKPTPSSSL